MSAGNSPQVVVHATAELLARAAAARLVTALIDAQAGCGPVSGNTVAGKTGVSGTGVSGTGAGRAGADSTASVVLTGGGIGTRLLAELAASPARDAVDWSRLDIWWGDERFLPAGDPERNETGARAALLDHVPADPDRVHVMPGPDGPDGPDPEAAADRYAAWLRAAAPADAAVPSFDVLLLGIGPEAHVASLFPGQPGTGEQQRLVVAVKDSPKPPPVRLSLTFPAIRAARSVWIIAAGADKADAVRLALVPGADPLAAPAAGARGREQTLFLLDRAAAAALGG